MIMLCATQNKPLAMLFAEALMTMKQPRCSMGKHDLITKTFDKCSDDLKQGAVSQDMITRVRLGDIT